MLRLCDCSHRQPICPRVLILREGGDIMLTECKLSKDEVRTLLAQVLDLKPRTCKIVLLDLLHGFSLEEAIQHSVRLQTISDQED